MVLFAATLVLPNLMLLAVHYFSNYSQVDFQLSGLQVQVKLLEMTNETVFYMDTAYSLYSYVMNSSDREEWKDFYSDGSCANHHNSRLGI